MSLKLKENCIKSLLVSLFALVSCSVTIPNVKVCAVAGVIGAGADCAYTLTNETEEMELGDFIVWLEPQFATETQPERGPALCQSEEDYMKIKIALEQACAKLGTSCTKEMKQGLQSVSDKVSGLSRLSLSKKFIHPIGGFQ